MRAVRANGEELLAGARDDHVIVAHAAGEQSAIAEIANRNTLRQIWLVLLVCIGHARLTATSLLYRTVAETAASEVTVSVHVFVLLPPLEHAPDQTASRPFVTDNVIDVPLANDADPAVPVDTLIPPGDEVTRSPLLPVAFTVNRAV
jgi:hypothetical protein